MKRALKILCCVLVIHFSHVVQPFDLGTTAYAYALRDAARNCRYSTLAMLLKARSVSHLSCDVLVPLYKKRNHAAKHKSVSVVKSSLYILVAQAAEYLPHEAFDCFKLLIKYKCDVNRCDDLQRSVMHILIPLFLQTGHQKIADSIALLFSQNYTFALKDKAGVSVPQLIFNKKYSKKIKLLQQQRTSNDFIDDLIGFFFRSSPVDNDNKNDRYKTLATLYKNELERRKKLFNVQ